MKRRKRQRSTKDGTTMVEVLVAFLVVMIMMAMFSKVVTASVDLLKKSRENIERTEAFNEQYYKTGTQEKQNAVGSIALEVDPKTSGYNRADPISLPLSGDLQSYTLNNIKRYSFKVIELDNTSDFTEP